MRGKQTIACAAGWPSRALAAILTLAVTLAAAVGLLIVREHQQRAAAEEARAATAAQAEEAWTARELAGERRKEVAERAAKLAEQERLAAERKERHVLRGTVLVPDVNGAAAALAGGRPERGRLPGLAGRGHAPI